jgi:ligand-binding sensor protein
MLAKKPSSSANGHVESTDDQDYGDLTALNRGGLITSSIDQYVLRGIASEYLDLLDTSSAIYEKNGDYAFGIFSSLWCRLMDRASRTLCNTDDNAQALASGKWLCHESCWTDCSKQAIETGAPVDIECNGGMRLYSVPIFAGEEVIGAINFGYGDPPRDPEKLRAIADSYALDYEKLSREASTYNTRPAFIIEMAKQRLQVSARLIGVLIERKQAEEALRNLAKELDERVRERTKELEQRNYELEQMNKVFVGRELKMAELKERIRELEKRVGGAQ